MRERTKEGRGIYNDRRLEPEPEDAAAIEALDRGEPAVVQSPIPDDLPTWRDLAERVEAHAKAILEEAGLEGLFEAHRAAEANPRSRAGFVADRFSPLPAEGLSGAALDARDALAAVRELRRAYIGVEPDSTDGPPEQRSVFGPAADADRLARAGVRVGVYAERLAVWPFDAAAWRGKRLLSGAHNGGEGRRDDALLKAVRELAPRATQSSQRARAVWIAKQIDWRPPPERVRRILRTHHL